MSSKLQQPPFQVPLTSQNGTLTPAWANWFRDLYRRVGQADQLSNSELATTQASQSSTVGGQGTSITSIQTQVTGLGQGRAL